ncbi:secreted protein [Bordetella ansorpii]|uniref:Secreted protein n=1 Tax=Bordetella ansorpii TaxID=288768 RepID=A0A157SHU5_9BORD|nr:hypothetical protein [Bordetella ansorpii]SAI69995.1 secreted protein [Bordetella ansorpii]
MSTSGIGSNMQVLNVDISSMDLETALMAVQGERTRLLDAQLADQIKAVQGRNDQIAKLNNVLSGLTQAQGLFPSDAKATDNLDSTGDGAWRKDQSWPLERQVNTALIEAGMTSPGLQTVGPALTNSVDENGNAVMLDGGIRGFTTKGDLEAMITKVKGMIDGESNSQQMDMLRLQSMSNKRNEAFDVMTNFVKKMQDSRSSIIGNMR